jgi:hypothetical protein
MPQSPTAPAASTAERPAALFCSAGPGLVQVGRAQQQRTRGPPPRRAAHRDSRECSGRVLTRSLSWAARTCAAESVHRVQRRASRAAQHKPTNAHAACEPLCLHRPCTHAVVPAGTCWVLQCVIPSRNRMADGCSCHVACAQRVIGARATVPVACSPSSSRVLTLEHPWVPLSATWRIVRMMIPGLSASAAGSTGAVLARMPSGSGAPVGAGASPG